MPPKTKKQKLQEEIAEKQALLALYSTFPEDTYNLNTVAVFSNALGKWFYLKIAEETWKPMVGTATPQSLADWIFEARTASDAYFEVYILTPGNQPIYASA